MKGLEISVLKLSDINKYNERFRLDAEFFKKEYLDIEKILLNLKSKRLFEISPHIIHPTEITRNYIEEGDYWFFRTQNIRPLRIDDTNKVFISKQDAEKLSKNFINKYDILITRTGANFGQTAVFNIDVTAIASSHTFILRNKYFNQFYLAVFFNTVFGRKMIDRGMYGGSQPEIAPYYLSNIPIPEFSKNFQNAIQDQLIASEKLMSKAKDLYGRSETFLMSSVGLGNFSYSSNNSNVKLYSESFLKTTRLDAEYYQLKFDELEEFLIDTGDSVRLGQILTFNKRGKQPLYTDDPAGTPVLNSKHVRENRIEFTDNRLAIPEAQSPLLSIKKNDLLVNGTGVGTIGRSAVYLKAETALADNHVTILRSNELDPVFLSVQLNSIIGKLQVEKYFKGSSGQIELYPDDIDKFLVWRGPSEVQRKIREMIEQSERVRLESEKIAKTAITTVELAIKMGENAALTFLEKNSM